MSKREACKKTTVKLMRFIKKVGLGSEFYEN